MALWYSETRPSSSRTRARSPSARGVGPSCRFLLLAESGLSPRRSWWQWAGPPFVGWSVRSSQLLSQRSCFLLPLAEGCCRAARQGRCRILVRRISLYDGSEIVAWEMDEMRRSGSHLPVTLFFLLVLYPSRLVIPKDFSSRPKDQRGICIARMVQIGYSELPLMQCTFVFIGSRRSLRRLLENQGL